MSHLSDLQRLKVSCILVVTLEVTYLGTQLKFWYFCTLEVYSLALNLSIMAHSLLHPGSHLRSKTLVLVFLHSGGLLLSTQPEYHESPK